jgi:pimeloyl-ACP methyl ester carboxylesterase
LRLPAVERSHRVSGQITLAVHEWGPKDAPPLVALHGLGGTAQHWRPLAARSADRVRLIALDLRGHGDADKPSEGYELGRVAADVLDVLGAMGIDRYGLVGHSWGAHVALEIMSVASEHVQGGLLVDGGFEALSEQPRWTWDVVQSRLMPPKEPQSRSELAGVIAAWLGEARSEDLEAIAWSQFEPEGEGWSLRLPRHAHTSILRSLWSERPAERFGSVTCPVTFLVAMAPGASETRRAEKTAAVERARSGVGADVIWADPGPHDLPLLEPDVVHAALISSGLIVPERRCSA